jgi:hypothetical protein
MCGASGLISTALTDRGALEAGSPRAVENGASLAIFDPKQISVSIAFYLHLPSTENARSTFPGIPPHCP